MHTRKFKRLVFVIEALNAVATSYYGCYLFFLLRDRHGFGNLGNLAVTAGHGLIFTLAAWQGGRFAQRFGYLTALKAGLGGMTFFLALGTAFPALAGTLLTLAGWTVAMCFTWAPLEALTSEGEDDRTLPRQLGIYNVVWAGCGALTYFFGGALFEGLGAASVFWLPALIHAAALGLVCWMERAPGMTAPASPVAAAPLHQPDPAAFAQPVNPKTFLRMAWLANPFAYIGINTVLAVIPALAKTLGLSTAQAGWFCSVWAFARLATFATLWHWTGWHYRFRWLLAAFVCLILGFVTLVLSHHLGLLVLAQIVFGFAIGLIYYSSLFYSMDVGDTKGEHGGLHEAMIGAGICLGPAVGATSLYLVPGSLNVGTYAVTALLAGGLAGLISLRLRGAR